MYDLITNNFQGTNITIALTGLPIVITGEVIGGDGWWWTGWSRDLVS